MNATKQVKTARKFGAALNYAKAGYEEICTGGNCTGFYRKFPDSGTHILITDGDNLAPQSVDVPVCAGLYGENGTWIATMNADTTDALFGMIARGEWEACAS